MFASLLSAGVNNSGDDNSDSSSALKTVVDAVGWAAQAFALAGGQAQQFGHGVFVVVVGCHAEKDDAAVAGDLGQAGVDRHDLHPRIAQQRRIDLQFLHPAATELAEQRGQKC